MPPRAEIDPAITFLLRYSNCYFSHAQPWCQYRSTMGPLFRLWPPAMVL